MNPFSAHRKSPSFSQLILYLWKHPYPSNTYLSLLSIHLHYILVSCVWYWGLNTGITHARQVFYLFKIIRSHYTDDLRMIGATFRGWLSSHSLKIFSELPSPWCRREHKFMLYPHIITISKQVLVTLPSHFYCETPWLPFKTLAKSSGHSFNPAGEGQRTSQSLHSDSQVSQGTQWDLPQKRHQQNPCPEAMTQ